VSTRYAWYATESNGTIDETTSTEYTVRGPQ
jgi:hypothetical protein